MIWHLIQKDLLRRLKNPGAFITLVSMPLIFALIIWLAFSPSGSDDNQIISPVKLLIEDQDDSFASQFISGSFGRGELENLFDTEVVSKDAGRSLMDKGKASALLIIPEGFGDSLLNRNPVELTLIKNPSESFKPKIAEETLSILVEGGDRLIRIAEGPLERIRKQIDLDEDFSEAQIAVLAIQFYRLSNKIERYLIPPVITMEEKIITHKQEETAATSGSYNFFTSILCGITAMFILFLLETTARDMFKEKELHTLYRLMISPAGLKRYIFSKMMFLLLIGLLAHFMVWTFARFVFNVRIPMNQWAPFVIFSIASIASLTSVIALIYAIARTRTQAMEIAPVFIIVFSMLGGSMISLDSLPAFIRQISIISPVYWSVDGFYKILLEGLPLSLISGHLLILGNLTLGFTLLSSVFYYRKFRI